LKTGSASRSASGSASVSMSRNASRRRDSALKPSTPVAGATGADRPCSIGASQSSQALINSRMSLADLRRDASSRRAASAARRWSGCLPITCSAARWPSSSFIEATSHRQASSASGGNPRHSVAQSDATSSAVTGCSSLAVGRFALRGIGQNQGRRLHAQRCLRSGTTSPPDLPAPMMNAPAFSVAARKGSSMRCA
jgi:hypothetical protein